MIAGRGGDYARASPVLPEKMNLVGGAADLERAGGLQVLRLEQNLTPQYVAEQAAALERRDGHLRSDGVVSPFDSFEQGHRGHLDTLLNRLHLAIRPAGLSLR